jgi:hypothetical protein
MQRFLNKLWIFIFVLGLSASASAAALRAGAAQADITPPAGLPMYGFFSRIKNNEVATGTRDPLFARVLVLETAKNKVAFITLDLGRTFDPATMDKLRSVLREQDGISDLFISASHTHSGPNIVDVDSPADVTAWENAAVEKIGGGAKNACHHLEKVRIGTGYGSAFIGYNRRVVNADGTVRMLWTDPTKIPTSPVDPTVSVLRIDRTDGQPLAILVNYACHPVVYGPDNREYSADFPGVMTKYVQQAFGGHPICFFLQGAPGDINPYFATIPLVDGAVKDCQWTGETLGKEVVRVAQGIHTEAPAAPSLQYAEDVLPMRVRWNPKEFRQGLLTDFGPKIFDDHADFFKSQAPDKLPFAVTTLLIDKQIAFVGMSGEPFVNFQIEWRGRCPVPDAFFLGYTNGYFDYIPTIQAATEGGYGAGDSDTYVEVGAGEQMLNHALIRIYGMLGKFNELPEDLRGK